MENNYFNYYQLLGVQIHKLLLGLLIFSQTVAFGQAMTENDFQKVTELYREGQTNKASNIIDSLRKNVSMKDDMLYAMLLTTSLEMNQKSFNYKALIKDSEEILKLLPSNEFLRQQLSELTCQYLIADAREHLGDFNDVITGYQRIIQLQPDDRTTNDVAKIKIASAYNSIGKFQDAIKTLDSYPNAKSIEFAYQKAKAIGRSSVT